jgi:cellulose synthase/poly-beta-1,6-N-acetylglucosamine synthase-like glycosyltransferase
MSIAVLLATRDGGRTLPRLLDRLCSLEPPPVPFRVTVVDNGSTDGTPAILDAATGRLPLRWMSEPLPGKNRALNRALAEAAVSDLVVLTDDDTLPARDWLCRLWSAACRHGGYDQFGGTIRPDWPSEPPAWLFDWGVPLGIVYAVTDAPEGPVAADNVWGPNMAVRGAVLRAGHRFDEAIGPDGGLAYAMGSETEFTVRLERAGHRAWFAADAQVSHLIRPEHLAESYVLGRAYRHGLGVYRYTPPPAAPLGRLAGVPVDLMLRAAAYRAASAVAARALGPCARRFWWRWKAEWLRGAAEGLRASRRPLPGRAALSVRQA